MKNKYAYLLSILIPTSFNSNADVSDTLVRDIGTVISILSADAPFIKVGGNYGSPIGIDNTNIKFKHDSSLDLSLGLYINKSNRISMNYKPSTDYEIKEEDLSITLETLNLSYDHIISISTSNIVLGAQLGYSFLKIDDYDISNGSLMKYSSNGDSLSYGLSLANEFNLNDNVLVGASIHYYMYSEFTDDITIDPNVSLGLYLGLVF
ncbi:porin family protein [Aliivibrio sp. EL58]|uniref:porin family protein n=1 Tax=Aliivibrio sp. EL58 TaxID=2107582 RepID=UPI000EFC88C7|nr:porin family protein [Aliivibrio sp. EL58]